jgi:high-affinity nickel permease
MRVGSTEISLPTLLAIGFVLGMRHATDADHLVAVSTIVARARHVRAASLVGALWGVGHTVTILLVGGLIVLFRVTLPPRVGLSLELLVAIMLVVLGLLNFTGLHDALSARLDLRHVHIDPEAPRTLTPLRLLRSLVVGIVHGLAGSAAVALLVLTTVKDRGFAMACIAVFGLGTVAGMTLITSLFALPFTLASGRLARLERHIGWLSGAVSIAFGAVLIYQIGFGDGLFTADPRWTPH